MNLLAISPFVLLLALCLLQPPELLAAEDTHGSRQVTFSKFSATLPPKWDGDEQTGFISDNPDEYALTLAIRDETEDNYAAQVTIYLLPNKPGASAETAAKTLTQAQGDPTEPVKSGVFWVFEGEPRTNTVKGRAITMVNADPDTLLIIIAQDPHELGSREIIDSLQGTTPLARRMLGQQ